MDIELLAHSARQTLAGRPYYPCLLLVHPDTQLLEQTGANLAAQTSWPLLPVGPFLAEQLLTVPTPRRGTEAERVLTAKATEFRPGPLICSELDILFDPAWKLEPLAVLRRCSRHVPLVALWPGNYSPSLLSYAVPEHSHYSTWKQTDLCAGCIMTL